MSSANQQYRISFQIENALNAANQIRQVGNAMQQTDTKFKTGKTGVDQAGQSLQQFSQRIIGVSAPLANLGNNLQQAGQKTQQLVSGVAPLNNQFNTLSNTLTRTGAVFTTTSQQMEQVSQATQRNTAAMQQNITNMVSWVSRISAIGINLNMLSGAAMEAQGMQEALAESQAKVAKTQDELTKMQEQGLEGTHQYTQATQKLEKQLSALSFQERITRLSTQDIGVIFGMLAGQTIPTVVEGLGKLKAAAIASGESMGSLFVQKLSGVVPALQKVGGALAALPAAMGPIGIALTALGGFLIAIRTNFLGLADGLNAAGKAIGDAVPALRPFLEGIKGMVEQLGILPPAADAAAQAIMGTGEAVNRISEAWKRGETSLAALTQAFGGVREAVRESHSEIAANAEDLAKQTAELDGLIAKQKEYELVLEQANDIDAIAQKNLFERIDLQNQYGDAVNNTIKLEKETAETKKQIEAIETQILETKQNLIRALFEQAGATERNTDTLVGLTGGINMLSGETRVLLEDMGILDEIQASLSTQTTDYGNRLSAVDTILSQTTGTMKNSAASMLAISEHLLDMSTGWDELPAHIQPAKDVMLEFAESATTVQRVDLISALRGNAEAFKSLPPEVQKAVTVFNDYVQSAHPVAGATQVILDAMHEVATSGDGITVAFNEVTGTFDIFTATVINATGGIQEIDNAVGIFENTLITADGQIVKVRDVLDTTGGTASDTAKQFLTLADSIQTVTDTVRNMTMDRARQTMTNIFGDIQGMIQGGSILDAGLLLDDTTIKQNLDAIRQEHELSISTINQLWKQYQKEIVASGDTLTTFSDFVASSLGVELPTATQIAKQVTEEYTKAMEDGVITAEEMTGINTLLAGETIKAAEATKEHVTVTQQLAEANRELSTSLAETVSGIREGTLLQEAFNQGWMETDKAFQDSIVSLATTQASIIRYNELLAEGKIQSIAFAEGQHEMISSFQQMYTAMANIEGQILAFDQLLEAGDVSLKAFNLGLREGQLEARNWFTELQQGSGAIVGMEQGLLQLADRLEIEIPAGFQSSTEAMQEFIGVTTGSVSAIRELDSWLAELASGFTEMLGSVDFDDFEDDLDDAIEEANESIEDFLDEIGADEEGPGAIKLRMRVETDVLQGELDKIQPMIAAVIDTGDKELAMNVQQWLSESFEDGLDDALPAVQAQGQKIIDALTAVINASPAEMPGAILALKEALGEVETTASNMDLSAPFETGKEAAVKYSQEIDNVIERISKLSTAPGLKQFATPEQFLVSPDTIESSLTAAEQAEQQGTTAAPQVDTTAATQALQQLQVLAAATAGRIELEFANIDFSGFTTKLSTAMEPLSLLGPATQTAVLQMRAAFDGIDFTGFTEKLRLGLEPSSLLGPATQQAVGQMNLAFSSIGETWPVIIQGAIEAINAQLATLSAGVQAVVGQMNQAFTSIQQTWPSIAQTTVTSVTATIQQLSAATQTVVGEMNTAFTSIQQTWPQIMQSTMNQVVQIVESGVQRIISAFEQAAQAAQRVADSIAAIGSAAQAAESDVQSLSTAIQNIPDGEAVIRVTYDVAPAPSGITPAFGGLGGLVTYGPGGRSGGSPISGGGGLGGGPQFGGGGIEPALQFGAQGGLGRADQYSAKEFNRLGILAPVTIDHPTKLLVGENGPELVSVTPINRNRAGKTGELSPFVSKYSDRPIAALQEGLGEFHTTSEGVPSSGTTTINLANGNVVFKENQGPIQILSSSGTGGIGTAGIPTTGGLGGIGTTTPGFGNTNVPLGTGQGGTFNVPGGQVSVSGNAVACVNGQCFGNMAGFGPALGNASQQQPVQQQGFQPVFDELGNIKAIETLIEWFKFLGLPTGASVPGTGNFTNAGVPRFAQPGMFAGPGFGGKGPIALAGKGFAFAGTGGFGMGFPMFGMPMQQGFGNVPTTAAPGQFQGFDGNNTFQGPLPAGMSPQQFVNAFMSGQLGAGFPTAGNNIPGIPGVGTGAGTGTGTTGGCCAGNINMTGGQVMFDANQGDMELKTSTGAISIAGQGGAFAMAGRGTAGVGLFGQGPTQAENQQIRQLEQMNQNLVNLNGQLDSQGQMIEFQQQQQQQTVQQLFGQPGGFAGGQPVMFQQPQQFQFGNFTGFGQGFQPIPGGGAVGSGQAAGNPLGFLNQQLGGFGIFNPFQGVTPGGTTAPGTTVPGTGTGGVGCDVCGAIRSLGGVAVSPGGGGTGGGVGGGTVPNTGNFGGGPGEPSFIGGGGGTLPPSGGGGGGFGVPTGGGPNCSCKCMPMASDSSRLKIEDTSGRDCNNHQYFDPPNVAEKCAERLAEILVLAGCGGQAPTGGTPPPIGGGIPPTGGGPVYPGTPAPTPGGQFGQPGAMQTGGGNAVAIAGGGFGAPIGQQPGSIGPIGNPPVPPRIVQEAGLPSQHPDVNQDPTSWQIVESAGLVGTYDIIDDNGDVVQLGFRTLRDAEIYLNYFISYYEWVKSGSTGIPGPVPVGGGMVGGGAGIPGIGTGGIGGIGTDFGTGGITATAGNASASAGMGGAFAQAGNAIASAGSLLGQGLGFGNKKLGPTPEPEAPFEPIPRAQGPFRSGQDNQEPIYDNSGIKIGADFGTPGDRVSMEDIEEGGGGPGGSRSRRRRRIEDHISRAIAIAGDAPPWIQQFLAEMKQMFGDLMINLQVNNMIDGNMLNRSMGKYQLKKVSVFT